MRFLIKLIGIVVIVTALFAAAGSISLHAASMDAMAESNSTNPCQGKAATPCFFTPDCPANQDLLVKVVIPPTRPVAIDSVQVVCTAVLGAETNYTATLKPSGRDPIKEFPQIPIQYYCRNSLTSEEPPLN